VQARDEAEILAGNITPTHMLAVLRRKDGRGDGGNTIRTWKHLTPAFCLRKRQAAR